MLPSGMRAICQMSWAYCRIVRSLEKVPTRATFKIAFWAHLAGLVNSAPTCACTAIYEGRSAR
jgi:hypothetical protein